jgi:hypothetical protein
MNQIEQYIIDLAAEDLPDFNKVVRSGRDCATQIKPGTSAFLKKYDCGSEQEYKRQCMHEGRI